MPDANDEKYLRLLAFASVQTADINILLELIQRLEACLRPAHPELPAMHQLFLKRRDEELRRNLEAAEKTQPELAAHILALIEATRPLYPPET